MTLLEFFKLIYAEADPSRLMYLWTLPDKKTEQLPICNIDYIINSAMEKTAAGKDVYFGLSIGNKILDEYTRPKNDEVESLTCLWCDIDIASEYAHKSKALPPDLDAAISLLPAELYPSIIVFSGYGIHAYWLLREEWELDTPDELRQAQELLQRLQGTIRNKAAAQGWHVDSIADPTRVLRVPCTWNFKNKQNPVAGYILSMSDDRYNISDFDILDDVQVTIPTEKTRDKGFEQRATDGHVSMMLDNCAFLQHWQFNYKTLTEPIWYAAITNLARGVGGAELIYQYAKDWLGAKYNAKDTESKINHALADCSPSGCQHIKSLFNCNKNCPVKNPASWSLSKIGKAISTVNSINEYNTETLYRADVQEALLLCKKEAPEYYSKFKENGKGLYDSRAYEKALKSLDNNQVQAEQVLPVAVDMQLPMPTGWPALRIPNGFSVDSTGIKYAQLRDNNVKTVHVSYSPTIITERIFNIDTGLEKMEIGFMYMGRWRRIAQPKQNLFVAKNVVSLSSYGLNLTSETAKYFVKYLSDLEAYNMDKIPIRQAVSRLGWRKNDAGQDEFLVPTDNRYVYDLEDGGDVAEAFVQRGNLHDWLNVTSEVIKYPMARFILATSFAAPLLSIIGHRNFMLYFWGSSSGGKTAVMVWALSVWGHGQDLMMSFNTSAAGLEGKFALMNDLLIGINERQVSGGGREKQELLERMVYLIEGGKGKTRATPSGLRKTLKWRTIGMASGEEPLSKEQSMQGVKTRLLEFNTYPVLEINLAKSLYAHAQEMCGLAGPIFVERLTYEAEHNRKDIKDAYLTLNKILTEAYPDYFSVHIDSVTLVCIAYYLFRQWLYQVPKHIAEQEAIELANYAIKELPTQRQISDTERAWDLVQNWIASNRARFERLNQKETLTPIYGFEKDNYLCIYPEHLDKALSDAGFSTDKILREFANKDMIASEVEGTTGKRRFKILTRHNKARVRVIKINLSPQTELVVTEG